MDKEKNAGYEIVERFVVGDIGIALGVNNNAPAKYVIGRDCQYPC